MKIYLQVDSKWWKWIAVDSKNDNFNKELADRNIVISDSAKIGDFVKIGNHVKIRYGANIGAYVEIGNYARIGGGAEIGCSAIIGDYVEIEKNAKIWEFARIYKTPDVFSKLGIFIHTGILIQNGEGIFYKAVRENMTDFYSATHKYEIGKGAEIKYLKRNQDVECGKGFHFTSLWGALGFLRENRGKIISAKIKLDDILAVHQKVRVKAYSDVQVVNIEGLI